MVKKPGFCTRYWQDKVAVVTGGSAGLGLALAEALAERGARVVLCARTAAPLEAAAQTLRDRGHTDTVAQVADVTQQADVDRLFAEVQRQFGRLDVLANCAGRSARADVLGTTPEDFDELMQVNFFATVRCTRAAAGSLMARGGHLINIGSLASKTASRYLGAYPASKFAMAAYTQQLRMELGPQGLHTLLVCPGPIAGSDAGGRYAASAEAAGLPESARLPGAGVKLKGIPPGWLAHRILRACERRKPELIVPARARLLFALAPLCPTLADRIVNSMTGNQNRGRIIRAE